MSNRGGLGERIADLRAERKMTQAKLADAVGCSAVMIAKIEVGARTPSAELLDRMAEVLNASKEDLANISIASKTGAANSLAEAVKLASENLALSKRLKERVNKSAMALAVANGRLADVAVWAESDDIRAAWARLSQTNGVPFLCSNASDQVAPEGQAESFETQFDAVKSGLGSMIALGASSLILGAVAGTFAGLGTYAAVASLATASTGKAIASLAGASATNATLAWLGRATGGTGITSGLAGLTAIVALPLIGVSTAVALTNGSRILDIQKQVERQLGEALTLIERNEAEIEEFARRVQLMETVARAAQVKLSAAVRSLRADVGDSREACEYQDLPESQKHFVDVLVEVLASITMLLALPVVPSVASGFGAAGSDEVATAQLVGPDGASAERTDTGAKFDFDALVQELHKRVILA